jgi:hypothetical protein
MALSVIVENLMSLDDVETQRIQVRSAAARQFLAEQVSIADWGDVNLPRIPSDRDAWSVALDWVSALPASAL